MEKKQRTSTTQYQHIFNTIYCLLHIATKTNIDSKQNITSPKQIERDQN